jgi:hypothetical protein
MLAMMRAVTGDGSRWRPRGTSTKEAFRQPAVSRGSDNPLRPLWGWATEHTLPALTLVGLGFYAGALITYEQFYENFGLEPGDAGFDYVTTLTHTAVAFAYWLVAWVVFAFIAGVVGFVFLAARESRPGRWLMSRRTASSSVDEPPAAADAVTPPSDGDPEGKAQAGGGKVSESLVAMGVVLLLVALFFNVALGSPGQLADDVKQGEQIKPFDLGGATTELISGIYRNPLRIAVERVHLLPADPAKHLPASLNRRATYAYLGRAKDTIIVYDSHKRRTLRVPATLVVVSDAETP